MRIRFIPHRALAIAVLLSGMVTGAGAQQGGAPDKPQAEFGTRGERKAREITYGDWEKICFKTPGTNMVCRTTVSGTWDTGQSAVRVALIEREGEAAARLQLLLPVGLYLQTAVRLTVDRGQPHQVPYVWCLNNTCIASEKANPGLIKEMESGKALKLEVVDTNLLSVSTVIPLDSFASAHKAPASHVYQQEVDE